MRAPSRPAPPAIDDNAVAALVDAFYGRVRQDALLAPVFIGAIRTTEADWADHLATLRAFWSSVMLMSGRYSGNPQIAHAWLRDLEPAMFDRWLAIFEQTCTDTLEPNAAAAFIGKANRIAHSLRCGVFGPPAQEGRLMASRATHRWMRGTVSLLMTVGGMMPAAAHVKWFAPYIVGAPPAPVSQFLRDGWFWLAIGLVLAFFTGTRWVEVGPYGATVLDGLDRLTQPMWGRLDDYVRAIVAAFFVAIFSVGGIYLTPDLKTPAEWVSWMQLVIAALVFWRATMPIAGAGIVALWLLALRDYDLFHLFDYLALGLGVAAYLVLAALPQEGWRVHRFEALRWGLAAALMWSSLEKFAYPSWFYPLVVEKPFLTFGLPRDAFIPMAGVAEFTLGFGLLWTPLIRRLSAMALFVIFTSAVWPFGRIEIIGHGLIMAILLAVAADHSRLSHAFATFKLPLRNIPVGLAAALVSFVTGYWGLHVAFYGPNGHAGPATAEKATHSHNPEHPDGPVATGGIGAPPTRGQDNAD